MSDIDLIRHSRIGQFGRVPIYLCHEDGCWLGKLPLEPSSVALRNAICIGGGGGEHPAAVINHPWTCVRAFTSSAYNGAVEIIFCDGLSEKEWQNRFYSDFEPYLGSMSFRQWMAECVGEFLFFMLSDIDPRIEELRANHKDIIQPSYEIVAIPWYPYLGRADYWRIEKAEQGGAASPLPPAAPGDY
jgi:hypothetical protein